MRYSFCPHCGERLSPREIGDEGEVMFCSQCNIPVWDSFTTSVIGAVVTKDREIALLRQAYVSTANCVCVAGIMKPGENAEECMRREIAEELGLQVKELSYVQSYYYERKDMLMLGFAALVDRQDFTLSGEVDGAAWYSLKDAPGQLREGGVAWQLVNAVLADFPFA